MIWPKKAKAAIIISFHCDMESESLTLLKDLLKKYKIKATLGIAGNEINKNKKILLELKKQKHEFASHTFSHFVRLLKLDDKEKYFELKKSIKVHKNFFGETPKGLIPPYTEIDEPTIKIIKKLGFKWTLTKPSGGLIFPKKENSFFKLPVTSQLNDLFLLDYPNDKVLSHFKNVFDNIYNKGGLVITDWHCTNLLGDVKLKFPNLRARMNYSLINLLGLAEVKFPRLKTHTKYFQRNLVKPFKYTYTVKKRPDSIKIYEKFLDYVLSKKIWIATATEVINWCNNKKIPDTKLIVRPKLHRKKWGLIY